MIITLQLLYMVSDKLKSETCHCELGCSNTVYEVEKLEGDDTEM